MGTEHILLGILAQNSSLGAKILAESGVTLDRVETALELTPSAVVFAVVDHGVRADVLATVRMAWELALEFGQSRIGTKHLVYNNYEIGRACVGKECRSRWSPYH